MNVSKLAPIAKAVVAFGGAVIVTAKVLVDGTLTVDDFQVVVAAWAVVFGVYLVPNKKG